MKRIFIVALAVLAFAGCKENKKGAEVEQTATEVVAQGDLAFAVCMFCIFMFVGGLVVLADACGFIED